MPTTVRLAQSPEADALLSRSPLAALTGMLLDQHTRGCMFRSWANGTTWSNGRTGETSPG